MNYLLLLLFSIALWGGTLSPKISIKTSSGIVDFVIRNNTIWAGTANGEALKISLSGKILSKVTLPLLIDGWGEKTPQKIMSIDAYENDLILAGEDGCLYRVHEGKLYKTAFSTKTVIKRVAFLSEKRVLLALLSNEIVFFDLKTDTILKTLSGGTSPLSDMAISADKKLAAIGGEAGIVSLIDTTRMKMIRNIQGGNVDNIYRLDLQKSYVATAGQDRRAVIYTLDGKHFIRYNGSFLIYSVALSPNGNYMASAMDEENIITIFDTRKHQKIATAKGHSATLNRIVFADEKRFVSCADENKILIWELP